MAFTTLSRLSPRKSWGPSRLLATVAPSLRDSAGSAPRGGRTGERLGQRASTARLIPRNRSAPAARDSSFGYFRSFARRERKSRRLGTLGASL